MKNIIRLMLKNLGENFRKNKKSFYPYGTSKSVSFPTISPVVNTLAILVKFWLSNTLLNQQLLPIYLKGQKSSRVYSLEVLPKVLFQTYVNQIFPIFSCRKEKKSDKKQK